MPTNPLANPLYLDLARRLANTAASDDQQMPIVVYRGEHRRTNDAVHTRTRTISFGSVASANTYAIEPNNPNDIPIAPRVMAAYLSIRNPVVNDRDDQFIDMSTIAAKLGRDKAELIARRLAGHIEHTGNWVDNFASQYESVGQLLEAEPERLSELYLDAYPVFDDDEIVAWFIESGYDGAIHSGNGETALEVEYKVFDRSQVCFAIGVEHAALAEAVKVVRALHLAEDPADPQLVVHDEKKGGLMSVSSLLKFQSNYRGQTDYLVLGGPLAGKRVTYRYMKREFYEKDYADYGAQVWRGDPGSYRREVLGSVGLVCCSGALVPQAIVDEVNRLANLWRDHGADLSPDPARAGVYVNGHGWTAAANVVFQYGNVLERFTSVAAAEQWLAQPFRAQPDRAWEEGAHGEIVRELGVAAISGRIFLAELLAESEDYEEAPQMTAMR
jgi:hypothetical protein